MAGWLACYKRWPSGFLAISGGRLASLLSKAAAWLCWRRGALYGIVAKHPEPEEVLYAMLTLHRKDASNAFKAALQAFGVTWERKTRPVEKAPA